MANLNVPLYDPRLVQPMREELTRIGFQELRTPDAVDAVLGKTTDSTLVVVNSVCGCAARNARPAAADEAWRLVSAAPGFLTEREARFLALAAACVPAQGVILEIGSFKGKSTVGLASVAARYRLGKVVAVDPHTAPSSTDPGL